MRLKPPAEVQTSTIRSAQRAHWPSEGATPCLVFCDVCCVHGDHHCQCSNGSAMKTAQDIKVCVCIGV